MGTWQGKDEAVTNNVFKLDDYRDDYFTVTPYGAGWSLQLTTAGHQEAFLLKVLLKNVELFSLTHGATVSLWDYTPKGATMKTLLDFDSYLKLEVLADVVATMTSLRQERQALQRVLTVLAEISPASIKEFKTDVEVRPGEGYARGWLLIESIEQWFLAQLVRGSVRNHGAEAFQQLLADSEAMVLVEPPVEG